ncbi:hypothetical protein HYALB_00013461 [Hymenoscyphus albidus]|uniref:NADP-dependent oxidoreductase domain-containing protein n=1 Tax=Hymenoscyphus albidus TaxID=595503 RepID=A0A9N9LVQ5_9HELO|nr:hypothetical protein HYALB_00013461 [Hymenoscyphus albidus]
MPLSGLDEIPLIGLGTFRLKGNAVQQPLRDAIHLGYRHIDTAAIYRNEKEIGFALQELYKDASFQLARSDLWITSKLSPYDMELPRAALLETLSHLQVEYLDLYLIHWPGIARKPSSSPLNKQLRLEAWNMLNEAKREGLVRHIGVSNFTPNHIQELIAETEYGIEGAFIQMEVHPWYWRDAMEIHSCFLEQNITMVGYALLAEGKLLAESSLTALDQIAQRLGASRVQVTLAWAMSKNWGVLVRSQNPEHMRLNLETLSLVSSLTAEDCTAIDKTSSPNNEEKQCWDPRIVT